jgi:hypothetical protein
MADKLSKEEVQATLLGHLTTFSEKVAEVVDDFHAINGGDLEQSEKYTFAAACMNDVTLLTSYLTQFVHETLIAGGIVTAPPPDVSTEADVIELDAYRNNGGLLN